MSEEKNELPEAYIAFETGDYTTARELLEQLVRHDDRAHLYLGWIYDQGLGVTQDLKQAEYHYRYLSNMDDATAIYYLAALLKKRGDIVGAVALFEAAADQNQVSAAYWAYALHSGDLAALKNKDKADFYLKKAATLGHMFARRDLARREMRSLKTFPGRIIATIRYAILIMKGFALIAKNSEDMRVR